MSQPSSPRAALHTPLCDLLGIWYPIIQAPMAGGWTTPELVAAVCNAGGLGVLAGARISPDKLREDVRAIKAKTDILSGSTSYWRHRNRATRTSPPSSAS